MVKPCIILKPDTPSKVKLTETGIMAAALVGASNLFLFNFSIK